ncbi:O-antigen ligase family protein [Luteolibacter yonseiensis]|uniref:O-antigen ligase family protein n=1 Tax=Luteolibacter yonseiensis TaxID=1144680 RepID=A0A934V8K2_9BACT|nr:O-antigen ligase family protein [Luteolibacter yonseiensis]MBK1817342.1 O-antigen ligase family protein [Luteolibacter yonseiensis]
MESSPYLFGGFWLLLLFGTIMVGGPWAGYHAVLLGGAAVLMFLFPPVVSLPRIWWVCGGLFILGGMAAFLPASWFTSPGWRGKLESLGLDSGKHVVIQSRHAAETLLLFGITLLTGLWLAGHRASAKQLRVLTLSFTCGVAVYAILSKIRYNGGNPDEVFGFFPNRNHTATYLAMGCVCGLGCLMQALRDKRYAGMGVALVACGVCFWAVAGWSISRGGVLLAVIGSLAWVSMLGKKYMGKHGMRLLGLLALAAVGFFFIADSAVKQRLAQTVGKGGTISLSMDKPDSVEGKESDQSGSKMDFRILTTLDTFDLIRDFKWTGVGAGQFDKVFPQYRKRTAVENHAQALHPESDWLWMAAETGIPATLALSALVVLASWRALAGVLGGRDRSLRAACLVAALLVPLHGFLDVPGHRIPLAWSSAFLFTLALHVPDSKRFAESPMRRWGFRGAAVVIAGVALLLARAEWLGGPPPSHTRAALAKKEAAELHAKDLVLLKAAHSAGQDYQPAFEDDLLERALLVLEDARKVAPMDRKILNMQGMIGLGLTEKEAFIDRCFALERALDPSWVNAPLIQAEAWSGIDPNRARDPNRTRVLWAEALERARNLDKLHPGTPWSEWRTHEKIRIFAKGKPNLEGLVPP